MQFLHKCILCIMTQMENIPVGNSCQTPWCVFKLQKLEVWHDLFSSSLMGLQIAYFSVGEDKLRQLL